MGRRQIFLLLLVLCVFASFVSAQSATVTFLDEWGEATSRVLQQSKVLLRVSDPAADTTPGRDSVSVGLSSVNGQDTATVNLAESGEATGVFEGEAFLTTDYALDNIEGVDADQLYTVWTYAPNPTLDTATATYGAASGSVEVGLSEARFVDGDGRGAATVTLGEPVRVRVRDAYADLSAGPDFTTATVTTSGGDSEVVTLTETGARTRTFEVAIPSGTGTPVAGDGRLQTAAGETATVTHAEPATGTTSSSDTATVAAASVSFIRPRDGRSTDLYPTDGPLAVRVVDLSSNLDPAAVESVSVSLSLLLGQDAETLTLRETGPDTGVFEGSIQHSNGGYGYAGNGLLESNTVPPQFDTVRVQYSASMAEAGLTGSITRLVDDGGADAESFALGSDLRVEVETAAYNGPALDLRTVEVRSLTTGDLETLWTLETDGRSCLFEGALPIAPGAAVPGDGRLQAQPGETVTVVHADANGVTHSGDQAAVVRSAVRFVDEAGLPVPVLLEETTARVRILDPLSAGQAPPAATIRSRITRDVEPLSLAEIPASPGLFEGSIPMRLWSWNNSGILSTGREYALTNEPDTITAGDGQATASLLMVPAVVEILNSPASAGDTLNIRVTAPRADTSLYADSFAVIARARGTDDQMYVGVTETGGSTGVFEGTLATVRAGGGPSYSALDVEPADTVEIFYYASVYAGDSTARVVGIGAIVPVAVELLDGQDEATSSYLLGDTIHVRVGEATANTDPATAEMLTATVSSRRYGDAKLDAETVTLTETGPDTGVFTGTLPTGVLASYSNPPVPGDGLLEFPDYLAAPDNDSTVTATRSGVSATARMRDSDLWLTDDQGQDATSFDVGSTAQVWMRRPLGNTTPGADTESVNVEVRTGFDYRDSLFLTLTETGGDTGLFTATLPTAPPPVSYADYTAQAVPGDVLRVQRMMYTLYSFDTAVFTGQGVVEPPNRQPDAVDDAASTNENTPVVIAVGANDTDPDGDTIEVFYAWPAANGTVVLNAGGTVTYTPNAGFTGIDSFQYVIRDGPEGSSYLTDTATVTVTVIAVNDPPNAVNDSVTTNEDTPVNVAVKANDTDPDGDPLTVTAVTQGANGSATIQGDGTVTYTPNLDFHGTDTFTYTLSDGQGGTGTATVTVTVTAVNDPPVAVNDSATTNEDTALNFDVVSNDTDVDGDALVVIAVTQGAKGSVVINQSPSLAGKYVIYTPNANANGSDSFTYTISDGHGGTATATVTMTITPVNDVPKAFDDLVTTAEDTPLTFDPRSNDTDVDGDPLTVTSVSNPNRGSAAINPDGTVTYTPDANLSGVDMFVYSISDGQGGTWAASVTVTVTAVNDAPDARNDLPLTNEDTAVTINVLSNDIDTDGDTLTITSLTQPAKGTAVLNPDKTITYTPNLNTNGSDSFTYTISDGHGGSDTATVNLTVSPVNDPPVAVADSATVAEDGTATIAVAANDTDPENSALTLTAVTQGAHGTVTILTGNQVRYQPAANYSGPDTFTYTIRDPGNLTSVGTVNVTVTPVNDPPVAVADSAATNEDTPATVSVLTNDTDVDGDTLTVSAVTQSANGSVTTNGATVTFTPAANWSGVATFTYTARDTGGLESTATVTVTVNPVNDPPVAATDGAATNEDTPATVSVLTNDTDVDGDTLTVSAVTQSANGSVTTNGATVTFTPAANWSGVATFTYTARDTGGLESTASASVTVNPVNDPPVAATDGAATNEDTPVTVAVLANDTDIDGGALSVTAVTQGGNGAVTSNGTTITYTPAANFNGGDSFTYTVSDGNGGTAMASVIVSIAAVNDAPNAAPDSGATREGVAVILSVLANDSDVEGGTLTVTAAGTPANGSAVLLAGNTIRYTPGANFTGTDTFTYTVSDGQGGTSTGQVTVAVGEALERVAVLATNSVWLRSSADVLSGDVIVNQAGAGPFLNGAELSLAGTVTTPAGWDVEADSLTVAAGAVVGSDISYNDLTNSGTINGLQRSPLTLPVFSALPAFLTATPGTTNISVGTNGTRTLAPGSYLDLVVGRKGTVTFTGGVYHFRSITVDREAKLLFSAASDVRVQQKLSTKTLTTVGPAAGASIDASSILFYVAGINGTTGALTATPKAVEIGTSNTVSINLYAPNGTIWLQDGTLATGAFLGRDVDLGIDAQVTLDSAFSGGQ